MQSKTAFNNVVRCRHAARLRTDSKAAGNMAFAKCGAKSLSVSFAFLF